MMEWTALRNLLIFIMAMTSLSIQGTNPFKEVPKGRQRLIMLIKCIAFFAYGCAMTGGLEMIPYSLLVILFQVKSFWTNILGCCINGEKPSLA